MTRIVTCLDLVSDDILTIKVCMNTLTVYLLNPCCRMLYTNIPHMCKADMWLPEMSSHRRPNHLVRLLCKRLTGNSGSYVSVQISCYHCMLQMYTYSLTLPISLLTAGLFPF